MSERKQSMLVADMLEAINHIQQYTADVSFNTFTTNFMLVEACLYNIQIIGEASSRLSIETKHFNPTFPGN